METVSSKEGFEKLGQMERIRPHIGHSGDISPIDLTVRPFPGMSSKTDSQLTAAQSLQKGVK